MKLRSSNPFVIRILALTTLLAASSVHAASPVWSGTTSNLWSVGGSGGNWTNAAAPVAGDTLNFSGNTNVSTSNDLTADTSFAAINFTNTGAGVGAFTLAGNRITLAGSITTTATALGSGGPLTVSDTISLDTILNANTTITTNSAGSGTTGMTHNLSISGIISETGSARTLTKTGTGTLTLSGPNTYTGTSAINVGYLAISNATALGTTAGNTTIAATGSNTGGQLMLSGGITSAEPISITGNTETGSFQGAIFNTSGTNTLSGNITLPSPSGNIRIASGGGELIFGGTITQTGTTRTLVFQAGTGSAITVNNAIANNNGGLNILAYAGAGASNGVTLKGSGSNNASTNIMENGLLKLGVSNALKTTASLQIGTTGTNAGFDVGTFDLAGFNQTIGGLAGAKNTGGTIAPDTSRIITNSVTATSTLTVGNGNATGTFNGVILDGGAGKIVALTKTGTGTQTLVGNSTYSGVTTISAGTIAISHANALGSTAGNTTIAASGNTNGGLLNISNGITSSENITITGSTEQNSFTSAILNTGGNNTLSGNITLNPSAGGGIRLGASSGSLTFSGNISQTGTNQGLVLFTSNSTSLTVNNAIANNGGPVLIYNSTQSTGTGTVTLKGVSGSAIAETYINQTGILKLGVTDALNTSANLIIGVASTTAGFDFGTFDLAGFNQTVNALNGNANTSNIGANSSRKIINSAAGTGTNTLTVGNGNGNGTFNGVIQDGATAKIALVKTGSGTQTLAGVNTYSGNTTVNGGILTLNNANTSNESSTVTIASSGATLNLNFAGTDTVDKLFIGATQMAPGVYGNASSILPVIARSEITGSGTLTVTSGPVGDVTPPTLTSIVDDMSGGPITVNTLVTYTVTFSEDINAATVSAADFDNQGTASISIGSIAETTPTSGVFTVQITPTSTGTLRLRIPTGAVISDTSSNNLVVPVSDDTTITVQTPYEAWAAGGAFDADANADGVSNGLAFLLGASSPTTAVTLPVVTHSSGNLVMTFNMRNSANRGSASLRVRQSSDLGISDAWLDSDAITDTAGLSPTVNGVNFNVTLGSPTNSVVATISSSEAAAGKLFGSLKATNP